MRIRLALALLVPALLPTLAEAQTAPRPVRPARLGMCVSCHGDNGIARMQGTPHLAGQDATYLRRALEAYRTGRRPGTPMSAVVGSLQPRDIEQLAAWYAAQPSGFRRGGR
jgi:cytochrome c553